MSRQEILKTIEELVSEGSGWTINHIDSHYINVTTYKPLHGSSYIELPTELRNPKKGLINIKNNVFGYENGQPFPILISKETFEDQMNLLLITKDEKKHYVLIKDFNAFIYNQSKHKEALLHVLSAMFLI